MRQKGLALLPSLLALQFLSCGESTRIQSEAPAAAKSSDAWRDSSARRSVDDSELDPNENDANDAILSKKNSQKSSDNKHNQQSLSSAAKPMQTPGSQPAPRSSASLESIVDSDYASLPATQRADARYISISHLNALNTDRLEAIRHGIAKALNSVSWSATLATPVALDEGRTVFRMSLNQYGFKANNWTLIENAEHGTSNISKLNSGATLVKGDWLVFALTRPEVYDRLIGIPPLESMLESKLGVQRSKAQYLGVYDSVVTYTGRILERIPIQHNGEEGYYWRSYDFLFQGALEQAIKTADLSYTASRNVNDLIAGEFIFSLPNGLQAYMLSGFGAQHRFDALTQVARDERRADRIVINGESCITCHARGLNVRQDQARPGFDAATLARANSSFPEQSVIDELFKRDNARFAAALDRLGIPRSGAEPIGVTIDAFLSDRQLTDIRQQRGETDAVFGN